MGASAAPQTSDFQCSTSCNPSPKFSYAPGNTYVYRYIGSQGISIEGVEEGSSNAEWSADVALTWVTPCDVAISLQNVIGSNIPEIQGTQIEKYPLVLAVNNGVVENTCSHPEDDASSINVKKAIASALQNALPSVAPTSETQVIKEDDVVGTCPTQYAISAEDDKTVVTKEKIHSECQDSTLLPLYDSRSKCTQEMTNGIYTIINCKDTKVITPGYGIFKYVTAIQEFTLQFISESADTSIISNYQGVALNYQTLKHENGMPIKNAAIVPRVDELMTKIC